MSELTHLRTVRRLAQEMEACGITEASIRWALFNREHNGLAASGAVLRPPGTRRLFIDRRKYEEWLRSEPERRTGAGAPATRRTSARM